MTFIEKLQQIERVKLYDLLCDASIWKSVDIDYHPPHVERLWCQLGNYRLYLHFIHPCKREEALFHPHPWPSVIHVIEGQYEMGMGFGEGLKEPEIFSTIFTYGGMYYEMPHRDGWHYVRPLSVTSSVMLTGEPWGREMPKEDEVGQLAGLHNDRVVVMLEYFKAKFAYTVKNDDILAELRRGDWVMLDEKKMDSDDHAEYGNLLGQKGFVIKNSREDGLSIRFGNDRYDEFNHKVLRKLGEQDKENNDE
ncbi:MAG: hypothetical protein AABY15_05205 [Nanoarchaeota archaeon]